jgi:hypothetical protein
VSGGEDQAERRQSHLIDKGVVIGNTVALLGLGAAIFDKHDPSVPATIYYVGIVIAGLCIVVPWIAKSIEGLDAKDIQHL